MKRNYKKIIKEQDLKIRELEQQILKSFNLQIIGSEINLIYLRTEQFLFTICGLIGSEVIGVNDISNSIEDSALYADRIKGINLLEGEKYITPNKFFPFLGKKIIQTRSIGDVWNGHGFELSFENIPDKTILIQSIYTDNKPDILEDCLRVGIGNYFLTFD